MAANQEKLVGLNGIGAVRDWANGKFALPGYSKQMVETVYVAEQTFTPVPEGGLYVAQPTLATSDPLPASMVITINGTEYTAPKQTFDTGAGVITAYGADIEGVLGESPDWSTYPFCFLDVGQILIAAPSADSFTFKAVSPAEKMVVTEDFADAVRTLGAPGYETAPTTFTIIPEQTDGGSGDLPIAINESVLTEHGLPNELHVVINGTEYTLPKTSIGTKGVTYGDTLTSDIPFAFRFTYADVEKEHFDCYFMAKNSGTYTISAEETYDNSTPDNNFVSAVRNAGIGIPLVVRIEASKDSSGSYSGTTKTSWNELWSAYQKGRSIWFQVTNSSIFPWWESIAGEGIVLAPAGYYDDDVNADCEFCAFYDVLARSASGLSIDTNYRMMMYIYRPNSGSSDEPSFVSIRILSLTSGGSGSGLPEVTSADNGDNLSVVDGAWAKSEPGYRVENTEGAVIAAEQSVTTVASGQGDFALGQIANTAWPTPLPASVKVTLNGTEYILPKFEDQSQGTTGYGEFAGSAPSFANYPCFIMAEGIDLIATPETGTYTLEIAAVDKSVVPTEDFKLAVKACGAPGYEAATKERVVLPTQTLTTAVNEEDPSSPPSTGFEFPDFPLAPPEYLIVTVNGTKYELPQHIFEDGYLYVYGELDPETEDFIFTTIPCGVRFWWSEYFYPLAHNCEFITAEGGDYAVSISVPVDSATPTDAFKNAVHASGAPGYSASSGSVSRPNAYFDATQQTIYGRTLFFGEADFIGVDVLSHATSLKLTVSGSEYTLPRTGSSFGNFGFGAEDFSDGPFFVWCVVGEESSMTYAAAEESGEYECRVEATLASIDEVSQDFKTAVNESLEDTLNAPFTLTIHITSGGVADRITRGPNNVPTSFLELHGHWDNVSHVSVSKDGGLSVSGKPYYVLDESGSVHLDMLETLHQSGTGTLNSFYFNAYYTDDSNAAGIKTNQLYASRKIEVRGNATSHRLSYRWSDIWDSVSNGVSPTLVSQDGNTISSALVVSKDAANNLYTVKDMNSGITYTATSENGYPTYTPS